MEAVDAIGYMLPCIAIFEFNVGKPTLYTACSLLVMLAFYQGIICMCKLLPMYICPVNLTILLHECVLKKSR